MEFPNSRLIDPSHYDTDDLFEGIPLRVHRLADLADRGALRAQKDWKHLFGGALPPGYAGAMGPEHNFVSSCLPETLPDRLELVAYVCEMAFLLDDLVDHAAESPRDAAAPFMADLLQARELIATGRWLDGGDDDDAVSGSPVVKAAVDVVKAMVAVDAKRAQTALQWLLKWADRFMSRPTPAECRDFDDYLEYRWLDVSSQAAFGMGMFALGLEIPEEQQQTCFDLAQPMCLQISLANDLHSWDREAEAARARGEASVTNAVWIFMTKHSLTLDDAKAACRERAKKYASEYLGVLDQVKTRNDLCQDAHTLLQALQHAISGNVVWGLQCPRYHPDRELNQTQLEMARSVWADGSLGWGGERPQLKELAVDGDEIECNGHTAVRLTKLREKTVVRDAPALDTEALEAPSHYLDSLPSKGIRDKAVDALNVWFRVPSAQAAAIKGVVSLLHGASLMLDDIQDSSQLRRGKPAVHLVFGLEQTINSAGYRFLEALTEVRKLGSERCLDVFCDELRDLYIGQSHDLSWTGNLDCPTEDQYLAMVDRKTAAFFRMVAKMLDAKSDSPTKPDITLLMRYVTLLGRMFQIRDDYMNLTSADYTNKKGFCEDLDEGKYSLPVIHALACGGNDAAVLRNLLSQRRGAGKLSLDQKKLFLEYLETGGSLDYTRDAMGVLQGELKHLAGEMGENEKLTSLLEELKI